MNIFHKDLKIVLNFYKFINFFIKLKLIVRKIKHIEELWNYYTLSMVIKNI